jgi:hypothetical protein
MLLLTMMGVIHWSYQVLLHSQICKKTYHCPFTNCTHSVRGQVHSNNNGWRARRHVRDHLNAIRSADLPRLTDAQLEENDLYVCRECKDELFVSLTALNNHVRKKHNPTRIFNNLQLVERFIFKDLAGSYESEWHDGLAFLTELNPQPPTFRQPLTTRIWWRLEQSVAYSFQSTSRQTITSKAKQWMQPFMNDYRVLTRKTARIIPGITTDYKQNSKTAICIPC